MPTSKSKKPVRVYIERDLDELIRVILHDRCEYIIVCRKVFEEVFGKIKLNCKYILTGKATPVTPER